MNKRLLIIIGSLLAIYLVYLFFIRKWLQDNGYNTRITDTGVYRPVSSFRPSDLEVISYESVQGLERI